MDYYQKYNPLLLARLLSCACQLNINDLFFLHFAQGLFVCVPVCLSVPRRIPTLLHGPGCNLGEW